MKVGDKPVRGLLQIGIRVARDSMEGFEEMIVRAILSALKEGQGLAQPGIPSHPRETPPYTPPRPRENLAITPHVSKGGRIEYKIFSKEICSWRS